MGRGSCTLNPDAPEYSGMCYSCEHYDDYGPVAGRWGYNGKCKVDGHETDALVKCKINKYNKYDD